MKQNKDLFGKISIEYDKKSQSSIEFYVLENDAHATEPYGIRIDKLHADNNSVLKSESSENIAANRSEVEEIIKVWIDELF